MRRKLSTSLLVLMMTFSLILSIFPTNVYADDEEFECENCGHVYYDEEYLCDCGCGVCSEDWNPDCWEKSHRPCCGLPNYAALGDGNHCRVCSRCDVDICDDCECCDDCMEKEVGYPHYCSECNKCMVHDESWCSNNDEHCNSEDCCWPCGECGQCGNEMGDRCDDCGLHIGCALIKENGTHCHSCLTACSNADAFCDVCGFCEACHDGGYISFCPDCGECTTGDGEPGLPVCGGIEGNHCENCCEDIYSCTECGECMVLAGVDPCPDCGLCPGCCQEASEANDCCHNICIESPDFEDHVCFDCGYCFDECELCFDCGRCLDCCAINSPCKCGEDICPESSDWEDHYCEEHEGCIENECDVCGEGCAECHKDATEGEGCDHYGDTCFYSSDWDEHWCELDNQCFSECEDDPNARCHGNRCEHSNLKTKMSSNASYHWYECADCGATPSEYKNLKHSFGEWNVVTPATETQAGSKNQTCLICGYQTPNTVIPAVGVHKCEADSSYMQFDDNSHWYNCKYCGKTMNEGTHTMKDGNCTNPKCLYTTLKTPIIVRYPRQILLKNEDIPANFETTKEWIIEVNVEAIGDDLEYEWRWNMNDDSYFGKTLKIDVADSVYKSNGNYFVNCSSYLDDVYCVVTNKVGSAQTDDITIGGEHRGDRGYVSTAQGHTEQCENPEIQGDTHAAGPQEAHRWGDDDKCTVCGYNRPVLITEHPKSVNIEGPCAWVKTPLTVKAKGIGLTYQWYSKRGDNAEKEINGATSSTYVVGTAVDSCWDEDQNGTPSVSYYCVVKDANNNEATSSKAFVRNKHKYELKATFIPDKDGYGQYVHAPTCICCEQLDTGSNNSKCVTHSFNAILVQPATPERSGLVLECCKNCDYINQTSALYYPGNNIDAGHTHKLEFVMTDDGETFYKVCSCGLAIEGAEEGISITKQPPAVLDITGMGISAAAGKGTEFVPIEAQARLPVGTEGTLSYTWYDANTNLPLKSPHEDIGSATLLYGVDYYFCEDDSAKNEVYCLITHQGTSKPLPSVKTEITKITMDHLYGKPSGSFSGHRLCCEACCYVPDLEFEEHKYGNWFLTEPATETYGGTLSHFCTVCDYEETSAVNTPLSANHKCKFDQYMMVGEEKVRACMCGKTKQGLYFTSQPEDIIVTIDSPSPQYRLADARNADGTNTGITYEWFEINGNTTNSLPTSFAEQSGDEELNFNYVSDDYKDFCEPGNYELSYYVVATNEAGDSIQSDPLKVIIKHDFTKYADDENSLYSKYPLHALACSQCGTVDPKTVQSCQYEVPHVLVMPATATKEGKTVKICTLCGKEASEAVVPMLEAGHTHRFTYFDNAHIGKTQAVCACGAYADDFRITKQPEDVVVDCVVKNDTRSYRDAIFEIDVVGATGKLTYEWFNRDGKPADTLTFFDNLDSDGTLSFYINGDDACKYDYGLKGLYCVVTDQGSGKILTSNSVDVTVNCSPSTNYVEWTYGMHVATCGGCGQIMTDFKAPHNYDGWSVAKEATSTMNGIKTRTCKDCAFKESKSIPCTDVTPHVHTSQWMVTNPTDALHVSTCTICGYKGSSAPHTYGTWTDNGDGTESRTCTEPYCEGKETRSKAQVSTHVCDFSGDWDTNSVCHIKRCSAGDGCLAVQESAHTFGNWEPTSDKKHNISTCSVCSYVRTVECVTTVDVKDLTLVTDEMTVGANLVLLGETSPTTATNQDIVWTVKDANGTGASITDSIFTATSEGTATITATIIDGKPSRHLDFTKDFTIKVNSNTGGVKTNQSLLFSEKTKELFEDDLNYTQTVKNAQTPVTYSSDNEKVATVNAETGEVDIIKPGTATITATASANDTYNLATASYQLVINARVNIGADETTVFDEDYTKLDDVILNGTALTITGNKLSGYPGYTFNKGVIGEVNEGSIEVTLYKEFLATLPAGTYHLSVTTDKGIQNATVVDVVVPEKQNYTVTVSGAYDGGTANGTTNQKTGDIISFNAGTRNSYIFMGWDIFSDDGHFHVASNTTEFIVTNSNVTATANWISKSITETVPGNVGTTTVTKEPLIQLFNIDVEIVGRGEVDVVDDDNEEVDLKRIEKHSDLTFEFIPEKYYEIANVFVDDKSMGALDEFEFENIEADHKLKVVFVQEGTHDNPKTGVKVNDVSSIYYYILEIITKNLFVK